MLSFRAFAAPREVYVSAAMSLVDVMGKLIEEYNKESPDVKVHLNLASSGTLASQIEKGAPVDIFLSASLKQMERLKKQGLLYQNEYHKFTQNSLVAISQNDSVLFKQNTLADIILSKSIERIAIGEYSSVPAGEYARMSLQNLKVWKKIESKLIGAKNVRQVLDYVFRREVDLGFTYYTDIYRRKKDFSWVPIPGALYPVIIYPMAILKRVENIELVRSFFYYLSSKKARLILKNEGFLDE